MSVETRMSADAEESLMKPVGVKKAFCLIRVAVRKERNQCYLSIRATQTPVRRFYARCTSLHSLL